MGKNNRLSGSQYQIGNTYSNKKKKEEEIKKRKGTGKPKKAADKPKQPSSSKSYTSNAAKNIVSNTVGGAKRTNKMISQTASKQKTKSTVDRLSNKYGGGSTRTKQRVQQTSNQNQLTARDRLSQSRNPRILDTPTTTRTKRSIKTAREEQAARQAQKMGISTYNRAKGRPESSLERKDRKMAEQAVTTTKRIAAEYGTTATDILRSANAGFSTKEFNMDAKEVNRRLKASEQARGQASKLYDKLGKVQDKLALEDEERKKGESKLFRGILGAEDSGIGMVSDWAAGRLFGGRWEVPLAIRSYGGAVHQAEKEGASRGEARINALLNAGIEIGTEHLAGIYGGLGKLTRGGKAAKGITERAEEMLTRGIGSKLGKDIAGFGFRTAADTLGEIGEEWIANPLENLGSNLIYGNRVQKENEKKYRDPLTKMSEEIQTRYMQDPVSRDRFISTLNDPSYKQNLIDDYVSGGMSKKQAESLANTIIDMQASAAMNDKEGLAKQREDAVRMLAGDVRKKVFDWDDMLETTLSTALLTAPLGIASNAGTAAQGAMIRDSKGGRDKIMSALKKQMALDPENSEKAKSMLEAMEADESYTPSGTQVYDIMQGESAVMRVAVQNQQTANRMKQKGMRRENLMASPSVQLPDGSYMVTGEATAKRFAQDYSETRNYMDTVNAVWNTKMDEDTEVRTATSVASFKAGSLTAAEIFPLTLGTEHSEEARYVFSAMTGVDLDQYNVYDKNGKLNVPKSNGAMQQALFAMSADNYMQSARIEQENWNDQARGVAVEKATTGMGIEGDKAMQTVLQTVDPRDKNKFDLTANAASEVYNWAVNTEGDWDEIRQTMKSVYPTLDASALEDVFEAGKRDRIIADTPFYGRTVQIGQAMDAISEGDAKPVIRGKFINKSSVIPKASTAELFQTLADSLNIDIVLVNDLSTRDENGVVTGSAEGQYIDGQIILSANLGEARAIHYVLSHELTHHLETYAPSEYQELMSYVRDKWYRQDPKGYEEAIAARKERYKGRQELTDEGALSEIIADASNEFWGDEEFVTELCNDNPSLAKKILDAINEILRKIRDILAKGIRSPESNRALYSELEMYDEAKRLWLNAYTEAKKNAAAVSIARWDQNAWTKDKENETRYNEKETGATRFSLSDQNITSYATDAYDNQVNMRSEYKEGDNVLGYVDWNIYNDTPSISYIEVGEEYRRRGIARKLLQDIQKQYPDTEINFGMTTPDGTKLLDSITYTEPNYDYQEKQNKLKESKEKLSALEEVLNGYYERLDNNEELSDSEQRTLEKVGRAWDDTNSEVHSLEREIEEAELLGDKATKTFVRFSISDTDADGKSLTDDQQEFFRYVSPELKDENGNLKRYYHGTARGDRVGYYFDPERATSGPMAYFTDNYNIAENYSKNKADTSLAYEGADDYNNQFVIDVDGEEVRIVDYWSYLSPSEKKAIADAAEEITYDDDYEIAKVPGNKHGNGGYGADPYTVRAAKGNAFKMLMDAWLWSGDLFNEEGRFVDVLKLAGIENARWKDPDYREEKVYEVYLNVTNPIVTSNIDEEFAADVEDWLDATDLDYDRKESADADPWDKNNVDPYDWLERLRDDIDNDTTHAWTSIPDTITDFLKDQGYDGIVDQGGKGGGIGHQVVIPFEPQQIKDINNEHPTEDKDIRYSISDDSRTMTTPAGIEVVQNPTQDEYIGMRTAFFETYPWMRGTGTPPLRRTFDENGNEYYWSSEAMHSQVEPYINKHWNTRTSQHWKWYEQPDKDDYPIDYSDQMARFSLVELDKPYMDAVNAGDMDEAQRLVNEAAESAGYKQRVFHGTSIPTTRYDTVGYVGYDDNVDYENRVLPFTTFEPGISGGIYTTPNRDLAATFSGKGAWESRGYPGTVYDLFVRLDNPLLVNEHVYEGVPWYYNIPTPSVMKQDGYTQETLSSEEISAYAQQHGYDGVIIEGIKEGGGTYTDDYIVFDGTSLKSADPVTYADDGSVIPLSERFDPTNNDIRYSLPTTDSDGKVLSDGQMEYFKNSQARDENGRLQVVYHTTNNGGFTVFDPSYSDDKRSLFFASNWDVSQTYGNNANGRIPLYESDIDLDSFIRIDGETPRSFVYLRIIDIIDAETGELVFDHNNDAAAAGDALLNWYDDMKEGRTNPYHVQVGGEEMSYDQFNAWMKSLIDEGWLVPKGYYQCYLNLENPLIVDAGGQSWNNIQYGEYSDDAVLALKNLTMQDLGNSIYVNIFGDKKINGEWQEFRASDTFNYTLNHDEIPNEVWDNVYDFMIAQGLPDKLADFYVDETFYDFDGIATYDKEGREVKSNIKRYTTRALAALADANGNDGVIIRNCYDIGAASSLKGHNGSSDIFIAFSAEQIKDIRNENPTENPDIRWSFPEDDEVNSRIAYENSISDSYDLVMQYEASAAMGETDAWMAGQAWLAGINEEDLNKFYAGLNDDEAVPFSDPVLEEDRVRMAKSKSDFYAHLNAKWQDRWTTEGELLDIKSVRKDIKELVTGVMANSDTTAKYRNDIVKKTLFDLRIAYQLSKQGRADIVSALLYHSAQRMIDNVEFYIDDTFTDYKELRDYLKVTKISLGEEYWADVKYDEFRKRNYNRLKLVKGNTNVDEVYQDLCNKFPQWFNEEEEMTPPDQLLQIEYALDTVQPYKEAYSSEAAAELAFDIADSLYDIMEGGKEYKSLADTYKERFDAKTKAMKQRHAEAMLRMRRQAIEGVQAERAKWRAREEKRKEREEHTKRFDQLKSNYDWLTERLLNPTKEKNIPEQLRKPLAELLQLFDFQTERSKSLENMYGKVARKTLKMRELKDKLAAVSAEDDSGELPFNSWLQGTMEQLAEQLDGAPIDSLNSQDIRLINEVLTTIIHGIRNRQNLIAKEKQETIAKYGDGTITAMDSRMEKYGPRKQFQGKALQWLETLVNEGMETASYFFSRIDPNNTGIGALYKDLERGEDKYIENTAFLKRRMREITGKYMNRKRPGSKVEEWRKASNAIEFNLESGETISLTPAQIMSIYCLNKRPQAQDHLYVGGIVTTPASVGSVLQSFKRKAQKVSAARVTPADVETMITKLTPEQIQVADQLQSLMSKEMSDWGNETSMQMYGIKMFKEKEYFPLKVSREVLPNDLDKVAGDTNEKIRNFGFTKPLTPNAQNAVYIDDIFAVAADHCNKMALHNAMAIPIMNFNRVYNYKQKHEDGSVSTVQEKIGDAFTNKANTYIKTFLSDLNGNTQTRSDATEALVKIALSNYKKAAIGLNGRVALQQVTALPRAFMEINPKYFAGTFFTPAAMRDMFDHCPKALWKSWGNYEMDLGRDMEDVMMNKDWSRLDAIEMGIYGMLDNYTWTKIWQAVKRETKAKHKNVEYESQEFYDICNERARDIFNRTQVVDSLFNRSAEMRSKSLVTKMMTSFKAEPTLTYNVFRNALVNGAEKMRDGDIAGGAATFGKAAAVLTICAAYTSAMAALWDAVRRKGADDDEDKKFSELWWLNFLDNFFNDNAPWKQWNNIYFISDAIQLKEGWGTSFMALEGVEKFWQGYSDLKKKLNGEGKKSWYDVTEELAAGIGYIIGAPAKTVMSDVRNTLKWFGIDVFAADGTVNEAIDKAVGGLIDKTKSLDLSEGPDLGDKLKDLFGGYDPETEAFVVNRPVEEDESEYDKLEDKAAEIANSTNVGTQRNSELWSALTNGYTKSLADADFERIDKLRAIYKANGGDVDIWDEKIMKACKTAYKKTLIADATSADLNRQEAIREYMTNHGVTDAEISDLCYRSETAKDLKAAMRLNNEDLMVDEMVTLMNAGISDEDLIKLYDNRNRGRDTYDGKYKDLFKSTGTYKWPINGSITSNFGHRSSPGGIGSTYHQGLDIAGNMGDPVGASDGGTVVFAGWYGGAGKTVKIEHDDGTITQYSHLSWWGVKEGDVVGQGQTIGNVGSTGNSTGPHLHFGVIKDGSYVNPREYLSE